MIRLRHMLASLLLFSVWAGADAIDSERERQMHQRLQQQALINDMVKWQQTQQLELLRREREALGQIDIEYSSAAEERERERKLRADLAQKRREDMMKKERDKREERRKGMSGAFK